MLLKTGNFSSVFSGIFCERSVAVERVKKVQLVDQMIPETLLKLKHMNIVKVFHSEEDLEYR